MLDAVARLPEALELALGREWFVLHSSRQSGKTTTLKAFARQINAGDEYYALYCSLEVVADLDDIGYTVPGIVAQLRSAVAFTPKVRDRLSGPSPVDEYRWSWPWTIEPSPHTMLKETLTRLCAALDKPLIIFFDEADGLCGQTLVTVVQQLRDGYLHRDETPFPCSVSFTGLRDFRIYLEQAAGDRDAAAPPLHFKEVSKVLTLTNFTVEQVAELYRQHTEATGQVFEPGAAERAWYWSEGHPWLVNALARLIVEDDLAKDYSKPITAKHFDAAADALIERNDVHIDYLLEWLKLTRVRKVLEPVLTGSDELTGVRDDDINLCLDLGLLKMDPGTGLRPGTPIYRDAIVRRLSYDTLFSLPPELRHRWMDGRTLDMSALLKEFQQAWWENSDRWLTIYEYREAAPYMIVQAYLQRVVGSDGVISREFALGRGRMDVSVKYAGKTYPVQLKSAGPKAGSEGLEQLQRTMDTCGASEGWLVIFDRDQTKPWEERIHWTTETLPNGGTAHIVGC
jgi:hypothetical protein